MSKKAKRNWVITMAIVVIGLSISGIGYYIENKDIIKIRSSIDMHLADTTDEEAAMTIKAPPEIDPLSSLMVFSSELANPYSAKIISQAYNTPGADVYKPLAEWATRNGYDAIMFGNILSFNDRIVLTGPKNLDVEAICQRLQKLGINKAVAFVINSQNLELPYPFEFTSQGHVHFKKEKVKKAWVWPTGKSDSTIESDNLKVKIDPDGNATVWVNGKPFEGIPTNTPIKRFQ